VAGFATDLTGLADRDSEAAQWVIRVVLSLLFWPNGDSRAERHLLQRFAAPAFSGQQRQSRT
jgi:hypothetical protein